MIINLLNAQKTQYMILQMRTMVCIIKYVKRVRLLCEKYLQTLNELFVVLQIYVPICKSIICVPH